MAAFIGGTESTINRGATLARFTLCLRRLRLALPWAAQPIGFAVGAEHRDYTGHTRPTSWRSSPGELGGAGGAILPMKVVYRGGCVRRVDRPDRGRTAVLPGASARRRISPLALCRGSRPASRSSAPIPTRSAAPGIRSTRSSSAATTSRRSRTEHRRAVRSRRHWPDGSASDPCAGSDGGQVLDQPANPLLADPVRHPAAQGASPRIDRDRFRTRLRARPTLRAAAIRS